MDQAKNDTLDRVTVREVAGVFHSRQALDGAVDALLQDGFDRADIDLMGGIDALRERLGDAYRDVPAVELADLPDAPRRAFVARHDVTGGVVLAVSLLASIGALAGGLVVAASGGALALGLAAAAAGGLAGGGIGALASRLLGREQLQELEALMATGGLVLWVRVRAPAREKRALEILRVHGAEAVRVHEIPLEKRLEDLPLHRLLAEEPRG